VDLDHTLLTVPPAPVPLEVFFRAYIMIHSPCGTGSFLLHPGHSPEAFPS
jgi:hypothetical protein